MLRVTLSTSVVAPKVLLTASISTCGVACGSSHGRRAASCLEGLAITAAPSEVRRRRHAPPRRCEERPPPPARAHHAPLPYQLAIEVDLGPDGRARGDVGRVHHGERQVALAGWRPGRRGHA